MKSLTAALVAAAVLSAGAAQAQSARNTAQDVADMQCMAVFALLEDSGDGQVQSLVGMSLLYYLGRLEGRTPRVDWLQRFEAWLRNIGDDKIEAEAAAHSQRCFGEIMAKADQLTRFGESLS